MREEIINTKNEAIAQITEAKSKSELDQLYILYLGRNGKLSRFIKDIRSLKEEEKKQIGRLVNETKNTIISTLNERKNSFKANARDWFDPTIPGIEPELGHIHLITKAIK